VDLGRFYRGLISRRETLESEDGVFIVRGESFVMMETETHIRMRP
jgi:hypothetical protein